MTEQAQKKYDEKLKRINDTLYGKTPDRVPIDIEGGRFMVNYAGYQMKDIVYDDSFEVYKECASKFLNDFEPDTVSGIIGNFYGEGPAHEQTKCNTMIVAGQNDPRVNDNSIPQYVEFETLHDDEFEMFFSDRTKYYLTRFYPRISDICKPFEKLNIDSSHRGINMLAAEFGRPEIREAITSLWKINDAYKEFGKKAGAALKEMIDLGYPSMGGGIAVAPFDKYSDTFRGTLSSLTDLYEREEEVTKFCDEFHAGQIARLKGMNKDGKMNGKYVQMQLHKGVDGFMGDEQYERLYWNYLKDIIDAVHGVGMIPMLFCEGRYSTRLKFLEQVPEGPILLRFETIDMGEVKRVLGKKATIGGGFPSPLLEFGTKQQVIDETKKLLDQTMEGGGFIFRCTAGIDTGKTENVAAMFETVKEYGKY